MTDVFQLIGTLRPAPADGQTRPTAPRPAGRPDDGAARPPSLADQLARLDRIVQSGVPPAADAPRGTYLNVVV